MKSSSDKTLELTKKEKEESKRLRDQDLKLTLENEIKYNEKRNKVLESIINRFKVPISIIGKIGFGYDINLARIVPCIFSIFGILTVAYFTKLLSKKNAY